MTINLLSLFERYSSNKIYGLITENLGPSKISSMTSLNPHQNYNKIIMLFLLLIFSYVLSTLRNITSIG